MKVEKSIEIKTSPDGVNRTKPLDRVRKGEYYFGGKTLPQLQKRGS